MNTEPTVSIGLPVYNGELHVAKALDSILAQTFSDFEVVISDNASTDQTETICRGYASKDSRVHYYRTANNVGAAGNFNLAFEHSRGRFFKWLAHDDCMAPQFLEKCLEIYEKSPPTVVMCFPRRCWINESDEPIEEPPDWADVRKRPRASYDHLTFGQLVRFRGVDPLFIFGLIRTEALHKTRLMPSFYSTDVVLLAELRMLGEFLEVPEPLHIQRCHHGTPEQSLRATPRGWDIWLIQATQRHLCGHRLSSSLQST